MVTTSEAAHSEMGDTATSQTDQEHEYVSQLGWKALFGFTTTSHIVVLISALISAAAAAATLPIFSVIYGLVFGAYSDYGAGKVDGDELLSGVTRLCFIMTVIAVASWIFNSIFFFLFLLFGELQAKSARTRIFDALIRKDMAWFDSRESGIAALLPTIQMHIRDLQLSVSAPLGEGLQCIIAAIAAMGVAFYYSWNLTLVVICTVPLIYLMEAYISNRLNTRTHEQANQLKMALKYTTNAIQSIETVKCFNGESYELQAFTKTNSVTAKIYKSVANLRSMQIGLMHFFTFTVFVQGFAYGSHLIISEDLDVDSVITTFWAALLAIGGITGFLPQFIVMQKGKVSGTRLRALMEQTSKEDGTGESQGEFKPSRCPGNIEFRGVTFSYPTRTEETALRNATLFFPAGETTFVIGKSGSGKSTLGQLLVRLYQPSSGQVLLDHVPLNELDVHWLRQNVTLVEQHSVLFNDSIQNNITLGGRSGAVTMDDVRNAVSFAMLEPIVDGLPAGLETNLGAKGSSLSGGEKQRMALARARIRDTPVLILDESTSALDYVTRAMILRAIREWRGGKTTIIITHDVSQVQPDDFLYLLDKAQVLQEGYHKDLESQPGVFQSFLTSNEKDETDTERKYPSEYEVDDAQTDEFVSLYCDSWTMPTPTRHTLSAVLFEQSVLSSFQESALGRSDTIGSRTDDRLSMMSDEKEKVHEKEDYFPQANHVSPNSPSEAISLLSGVFEATQLHTARTSKTLLNDHISRTHSLKGNDYELRLDSRVSSQPASDYSAFLKRLSIATARTSHFPQPGKYLRRRKLLSRDKIVDKLKLPDNSLSITQILRTVWPSIDWRSRIALFAAVLATLVHAVATPVFAWAFSQLLATFYAVEDSKAEATKYLLVILGIAIADGLAEYSMFYLYDSVAQSWVQALKTEAMRRILAQPREFFDKEENSMACMAETLDHFAEEARNLPGRFAGIFLSMFLVIAVSVTWSLFLSWKVTLVALASGPLLYMITQAYNLISSHWENLANEAADTISQVFYETFVNIRTVRSLNLEVHFRKKYKEAATIAVNVGVKRAIYSGSIFGLLNSSVFFVTIALFWFGAWLISRKDQSVLTVTETFMILMVSINDVSQMSQYMTQVNISREAGARLLRLARLPETSHEHRGTLKIESAGDISFNNVSFTYPTRLDHQVLHNISFSIPRGSCTAIVGSSGSGKSTIAALLLKLYPTSQNMSTFIASGGKDLTISGENIGTLSTGSLRSRMAIVGQTPVLFPGTIAQNIAYALSPSSPESGMESIRSAADAAGVSEFIDSLPSGYQTLIGDGGTVLSGGQVQRIAIARALVRNPGILILDEATSALDAIAAATIRETILRLISSSPEHDDTVSPPLIPRSKGGGLWADKGWEKNDLVVGTSGWIHARGRGKEKKEKKKKKKKKKQMTVIIITHAKEMMSIAEHIIMLDKGKVVEEGGYLELKSKRSGAFAKLLRGEAR